MICELNIWKSLCKYDGAIKVIKIVDNKSLSYMIKKHNNELQT